MSARGNAVVVGAGIIGVCCALSLTQRGWRVTLLDRLDPGQACSFGNAGILAAQASAPVPMPGLLRRVPRMLLDPQGPLVVRSGSLHKTWPWLWRFARAATLEQAERSADAIKALYGSSVQLHQALALQAGVPHLIRTTPGLYVHRDPAALDPDNSLLWRLRRERGANIEVLDEAALHDAEPALARHYRRGIRMGPMGFTTDPLRLTQAYAALLVQQGGAIRRADVRAIQAQGPRVDVVTDAQTWQADAVVVAAGAWSSALLRRLGLKLPLVAERGYHLQFADTGIRLQHVVAELEHAFAVTPMDDGLRVAGTEEIGLADDPPLWARAQILQVHAGKMFPGARLAQGTRWMGPRPGTPDSLPAIGALHGHANIFVAAGHGHLGLTGAPNTGRIVAALAGGETPDLAMDAYSPQRFERKA